MKGITMSDISILFCLVKNKIGLIFVNKHILSELKKYYSVPKNLMKSIDIAKRSQ